MSLKRLLLIGSLSSLLLAGRFSHAQAVPTAEGPRGLGLQIGGGWSIAAANYGPKRIKGLSIYSTYDFTRHWGIEGTIHRISSTTPGEIGEDSYLIGPRYAVHFSRFHPYAKAQFGIGRFKNNFTNRQTAYTFKIYSFGGGLDINVTRRLNLRAIDLEYQKWPSFQPGGLSPKVLTVGAAYSFH